MLDATPVPVPVGDCRCPGAPHGDGDLVYLAPLLSMAGGMAAQGAIADAGTDAVRLQELLAKVYIRHAIVGWNLVDESGDAVPLTEAAITAYLPYGKGGRQVAEKADELYAQDVLAPFEAMVERLTRSSAGSISRSRASSSTRRSTRKRR